MRPPKRCTYDNEDKDDCPNVLRDKNYQPPSQISRQILIKYFDNFFFNSIVVAWKFLKIINRYNFEILVEKYDRRIERWHFRN